MINAYSTLYNTNIYNSAFIYCEICTYTTVNALHIIMHM